MRNVTTFHNSKITLRAVVMVFAVNIYIYIYIYMCIVYPSLHVVDAFDASCQVILRMVFRGRGGKVHNKKVAKMTKDSPTSSKVSKARSRPAIFPGPLPASCTHTAQWVYPIGIISVRRGLLQIFNHDAPYACDLQYIALLRHLPFT